MSIQLSVFSLLGVAVLAYLAIAGTVDIVRTRSRRRAERRQAE